MWLVFIPLSFALLYEHVLYMLMFYFILHKVLLQMTSAHEIVELPFKRVRPALIPDKTNNWPDSLDH